MSEHSGQSRLAPEPFPEMKTDGEKLLIDAIAEHDPSHVFALLSGGGDSTVLTSWAQQTIGSRLDAAVYIDTGTAIPTMGDMQGVRDFVEDFCDDRRIPLIVYEAGREYERMVLQHGVPGPGAHLYPYVRLKERQIDALIRDHKQSRRDRILLLAGVRRAESERRMGTAVPIKRDGAQVWVNPLIDWTDHDMRGWRERRGQRPSDVSALLHRSGECNCGAYAAPGERDMLRALFPDWFEDTIGWLERESEAKGLPCVWGERWEKPVDDPNVPVGLLCHDCQPSLLDLLERAA